LKFVAFEAEKQLSLHFAVRKDWPELVSVLDKTLASITQEERLAINAKWIDLGTETDYGPLIRNLLIAGSAVFLILLVSLCWVWILKREAARRVKIQEDLEKAKLEAEAANNVKSGFMARMSHEVRTPLNAINGMAYLLKKSELAPTQKMYVDRIIQSSNTMLSIINDILDFSKIEAGKVELEHIAFNIDNVLQNVIDIVSYKIEEQRIGFSLTKDPRLPNFFFGDSRRIEQILINLINNAAKFTESGTISFDVRMKARKASTCLLLFTIEDTGIGMTEEQANRLFEPFSQGDASINRRFGGTGLGLAIVKNLLDMMGGEIQVYSSEGRGTTFIIQVELEVDAANEEEHRKRISSSYFRNIKTLVLEKTGANMNLIDSYLSSFGMECEITTSEASARSMLETANDKFSKPFDLLIIDYETPEEKAFSFVDKMRVNPRIVKMPAVILLLPMMREDLFDRTEEHGIEMAVGKPVIQSVLFNAIQEIFKLKAVSSVGGESQDKKEQVAEEEMKTSLGTILVVEDNKTNQLIAKSLLEQEGFSIILADDGEKGVAAFREHFGEIRLVLMDLHMPVLNGYDASLRIKETAPAVPIIALTADVVDGVREKCEQHGITDYISKPFDPEGFVRKVVETVGARPLNVPKEKGILDRAMGLRFMGNNEALYKTVLSEYARENGTLVRDLAALVEAGQYDDAAKMVHKVKSSSGSIGATALHETARDLQRALEDSDGEKIRELHGTFSRQMETLLAEIGTDL
ncbi:MAG TPA: ATP-binding protein, partial [Aminivibrio sp.]|nr:ATP-binding protein [Aminivibrio sp.]